MVHAATDVRLLSLLHTTKKNRRRRSPPCTACGRTHCICHRSVHLEFLRFNMKPRRFAAPQEVREWRNFRRQYVDIYERMHQCQLARAYKLNMFPEYEPLLVGTVVNVRATKKEIKDNMALYVGVVCPWRHPRYPPSERKRDASQVAFGWIVVQP